MRYVLLLAAGISLFACNAPTNKTNTETSTDQPGKSAGLTAQQIYEKDLIIKWVKSNKGKNKVSDKYFLEGVDMYRNKRNPESAVELFKKSIMEQPQARAYFELGNALAEVNNLPDAALAYQLAEVLDYKPTSKVLYNLACVYSRAKDYESARYYLVSAIEFGYSNVKNIYADKDLAYIREEKGEFNSLVTSALSGATDPSKLQWNMFWHEFKPVSYPLVLNDAYGQQLKDGPDYISYEYERFVAEMRDNERFSREVGYEFYHVGLAKSTDSIKTLIYAVHNVMNGYAHPLDYYIVSFDDHGKLIDKLEIGGQKKLSDPFRVPTLTENGDIEIGLFTKVYQKDPEKVGYDGNEVVENKFLDKEYYAVTADGHFVKKDALLGMNR